MTIHRCAGAHLALVQSVQRAEHCQRGRTTTYCRKWRAAQPLALCAQPGPAIQMEVEGNVHNKALW